MDNTNANIHNIHCECHELTSICHKKCLSWSLEIILNNAGNIRRNFCILVIETKTTIEFERSEGKPLQLSRNVGEILKPNSSFSIKKNMKKETQCNHWELNCAKE